MLLITTIALTLIMIYTINELRINENAVNYLETLNSDSQRLIKLELADNDDIYDSIQENLILDINNMVNTLFIEDFDTDMKLYEHMNFSNNIALIHTQWLEIQKHLTLLDKTNDELDNLIYDSEVFYLTIKETIDIAKTDVKNLTNSLMYAEFLLVLVVISLIYAVIIQSLETITIKEKFKKLSDIAFIDDHTKLPNKSLCNKIIIENSAVTRSIAVFMFDLNFLKHTNDTLGHVAGDEMIASFANIIRNNIPSDDFVGRFGGDEFIAVINFNDVAHINKIISNINKSVKKHNDIESNIKISFAYGYATSDEFSECGIQDILDVADNNMYRNKQKQHEDLGKDMR